ACTASIPTSRHHQHSTVMPHPVFTHLHALLTLLYVLSGAHQYSAAHLRIPPYIHVFLIVWYVLSKTVSPNGRSFHSMQATSQALQPMQVVVSMSLHTVYSRCVSSPGTLPAWPEIF